MGEGTGTRLGFLHFSKAWKTSGPIWSPWRPDLLPELSSLHCRPLFLFPSTVRPRVNRLGPFGAPQCHKMIRRPLRSPSLRPLSNPSLRSPPVDFPGLGHSCPRLCLRAIEHPSFLARCRVTNGFLSFPLPSSRARHRVDSLTPPTRIPLMPTFFSSPLALSRLSRGWWSCPLPPLEVAVNYIPIHSRL